jgi:hypothetical protein
VVVGVFPDICSIMSISVWDCSVDTLHGLTGHDHGGDVDDAAVIERQAESKFIIVCTLAYVRHAIEAGIRSQLLEIRDICAARHAEVERVVVL